MVNLEKELAEAERQLREVEATNKSLTASIEEEISIHKTITEENAQDNTQDLKKYSRACVLNITICRYESLLQGVETLHNLRILGAEDIGQSHTLQ